jgi:tRNA-splicing ligase RtcB
MADVHAGRGATVGSVIAMQGAVAPAAVGVDVGCGMLAARSSLRAEHLPDSLRELRLAIEARVPVDRLRYAAQMEIVDAGLGERRSRLFSSFAELTAPVQLLVGAAELQLGTLGGGNHFIELCLDTEGAVWVLLHSGSRRIGATLAAHHMEKARHLFHNRDLPEPDLAVFLAGTHEFDDYRRDLYWAQEYAALNRDVMFDRIQGALRERWPDVRFEEAVRCHHNYVAEECHFGTPLVVTRKGAIFAGRGALGIIPGSMGAKSFIVRGKGNPLSFESASHGAGRRLSRTQARRSYSVRDLVAQTRGVECRKDAGVLDEAPKAYKDIERVMMQQADLVEVAFELRQVLCIKG